MYLMQYIENYIDIVNVIKQIRLLKIIYSCYKTMIDFMTMNL